MNKRKRNKQGKKQTQLQQNRQAAKFPEHPKDVFLNVDFSQFEAVYKPTSYTDFGLAKGFVLTFNLTSTPGSKNGDFSCNRSGLVIMQSIPRDILCQYFGLYVEHLISKGLSKKLEHFLNWSVINPNLMYCVKSFVASKQTQQNLKGN